MEVLERTLVAAAGTVFFLVWLSMACASACDTLTYSPRGLLPCAKPFFQERRVNEAPPSTRGLKGCFDT